jgi:hypothetical protein
MSARVFSQRIFEKLHELRETFIFDASRSPLLAGRRSFDATLELIGETL